MIQEPICIFFDFEATSLKATEDHPIEIAAYATELDQKTGKFQDVNFEFHSYIFTNKKCSMTAQAIHQISPDKVAGAPPFCQVMNNLATEIQTRFPGRYTIWLGHNCRSFDENLWFCHFYRCTGNVNAFGQWMKSVRCIGFCDTLLLLQAQYKTKAPSQLPKDPVTHVVNFQLGTCYASFVGKSMIEAHHALADSKQLAEMCSTQKWNFRVLEKGAKSLAETIKRLMSKKGTVDQELFRAKQYRNPDTNMTTTTSSEEDTRPKWGLVPMFCLNCVSFQNPSQHLSCQ